MVAATWGTLFDREEIGLVWCVTHGEARATCKFVTLSNRNSNFWAFLGLMLAFRKAVIYWGFNTRTAGGLRITPTGEGGGGGGI